MCSYAMLIKRWYFPIFIFVGLGKVAGGFHGIGGEIRRPPGSNDKPGTHQGGRLFLLCMIHIE